MKRRAFLTGLTAGALARPVRATQPLDAPVPAQVLLILPDIGPSTDPGALTQALQSLVDQALPANLVIRPEAAGGVTLTPDMPLAEVLRTFAARFPGLIEIVAWAPSLSLRRPFQVARDAMEARRRLASALWGPLRQDRASVAVVSIATEHVPAPFSVADVLSAGFRNVLALPAWAAAVEARLSPGGVLTVLGGSVTDLDAAERHVANSAGERQVPLILSLSAFDRFGQAGPGPAVARLAVAVRRQELDGRATAMLARELQMRTDLGYRPQLALHIVDAQSGDAEAVRAVRAFCGKLGEANLRYSIGKPIGQTAGRWSEDEGYWIPLPPRRLRSAATPAAETLMSVQRAEGSGGTGWQGDQPLAPGIAVVLSPERSGICGLDGTSTLHVPVLSIIADHMSADAAVRLQAYFPGDGLILIEPGSIATEAERNLAIRVLRGLSDGGVVQVLPLGQFVVERMPDDEVLPTCLRTERFRATYRTTVARSEAERKELRADAAMAWRYFAGGTHPATGLCPSTMVAGASATEFASITMWEAGSLFNAVMAALDLGLIDDDDFLRRTKAILKTLGRTQDAGRTLPPEWIDTRTGRSSRNFNSFDAGRLLLALDRLRRHRLAPKGVDKLVAGWDFGTIIRNRRLHSIKEGVLVDDYNSNYTEYAAKGFRTWGHDVTSPFEFLNGAMTADQRMALLYAVARIGPIGAEPGLLDLMDSGASATADFLADVLFAAQADAVERTGRLLYPSESPIDRPPWFAFQGYSVDARDDPWTIKFDRDDAAFQTADFLKATRANSPKAAYLWHAFRPGTLADQMVERTRALARSEGGFLSAIYVEDALATHEYTDLNTNSVILQAITFTA